MAAICTLADLPLHAVEGQPVLLRVDWNVPFNEAGQIASDNRMQETLPTLSWLLQNKAKIIVLAHLGRPKGKPNPAFSLAPVAEHLKTLLPQTSITFCPHLVGPEAEQAVAAMHSASVLVLENTRFDPREEANDAGLSQGLATLANVYVNDAFGAAHRAHASTEGVARLVPYKAAGLLMQKELETLHHILDNPGRPFTAIVGGSKVSTKIDVLTRLLNQVDNLVIGGGMIFTFLQAQGFSTGSSLIEADYIETAQQLLTQAQQQGKQIVLPQDIVVADAFTANAAHQVVAANAIPDNWMGLDIGPEATQSIVHLLTQSKTVFWNGPLGVFEFEAFAQGTEHVARALAQATQQHGVMSVLGGGDTQAAIAQFGIAANAYTHVSTGGGATLELLEGKELPGVSVLEKNRVAC